MDPAGKLGERIQILRKHYRMNQNDLADLLNLDLMEIQNLEKGRLQELSQASLKILREDLQVSLHWLLQGEGAMLDKTARYKTQSIPKPPTSSSSSTSPTEHALYQHLIRNKDLLIQSQSEEIKNLRAHISQLEKELAQLKKPRS